MIRTGARSPSRRVCTPTPRSATLPIVPFRSALPARPVLPRKYLWNLSLHSRRQWQPAVSAYPASPIESAVACRAETVARTDGGDGPGAVARLSSRPADHRPDIFRQAGAARCAAKEVEGSLVGEARLAKWQRP